MHWSELFNNLREGELKKHILLLSILVKIGRIK